MKKIYVCLLSLLVCGCYTETGGYRETYYGTTQPVYYTQPSYVVSQPIVYQQQTYVVAQPSTSIMYIERRSLAPEIYDPHPLPPLHVYHSHKSRPHHHAAPAHRHFSPAKKHGPTAHNHNAPAAKHNKPANHSGKPGKPHKL